MPIDFTWEVLSLNNRTIEIQLNFNDPIIVSNGVSVNHNLNVKIQEEYKDLFESTEGEPLDSNNTRTLES